MYRCLYVDINTTVMVLLCFRVGQATNHHHIAVGDDEGLAVEQQVVRHASQGDEVDGLRV